MANRGFTAESRAKALETRRRNAEARRAAKVIEREAPAPEDATPEAPRARRTASTLRVKLTVWTVEGDVEHVMATIREHLVEGG